MSTPAEHQEKADSHFDRKKALKRFYPNRQFNDAYNELYNASLNARYLPLSQCASIQEVRQTLIDKRFGMFSSMSPRTLDRDRGRQATSTRHEVS